MLISIETRISSDFPGGPDPLFPLWHRACRNCLRGWVRVYVYHTYEKLCCSLQYMRFIQQNNFQYIHLLSK